MKPSGLAVEPLASLVSIRWLRYATLLSPSRYSTGGCSLRYSAQPLFKITLPRNIEKILPEIAGIEGLLGLSFLRHFRTLIDYSTGILEITAPAT